MDRPASINIELEGNTVSLGDITVSAVRRTNTEISMITDISQVSSCQPVYRGSRSQRHWIRMLPKSLKESPVSQSWTTGS